MDTKIHGCVVSPDIVKKKTADITDAKTAKMFITIIVVLFGCSGQRLFPPLEKGYGHDRAHCGHDDCCCASEGKIYAHLEQEIKPARHEGEDGCADDNIYSLHTFVWFGSRCGVRRDTPHP